jgi:hypothetical protein
MGAGDPSGKDGFVPMINRAAGRDAEGTPEIFARLYRELHRVATRLLRAHGADLTLGATTLLHET